MDFHALKRKELQALCKEHKIPANLKNVEMADKLTQLFKEKEKPPIECDIVGSVGIGSNDAVVDKKVKKVRFSPENELLEFTISCDRKRRGRRGTVSSRLPVDDVDSGEVKLVKKRGRRSVKINEDYCEKRIKVVDISDATLFADVGGDEVVEEVVEVQGRVTRAKAQRIGGVVKGSLGEVKAYAKLEPLDVKLKGGMRKSVMPSTSGTFELKGPDNQVTDTLSSVSQIESGGEVKPDAKVEAVEVLLRRGRRRSVMPSNWGTLDLPTTNESTNKSSTSELQVEAKDFAEPGGKIEAVKVGLRRGRRKSTMLSTSGTLDFAHNTEGANTSKRSAGEIEDAGVELRRSRRKSLMPPRLGTFEFEGCNEGRNTSKMSLLKIDEAAGDSKDEQKVPEVVGILKRSRHNKLNLSASENLETSMQGSGTVVEEHETFVQNNTRRSKKNASNKSLSIINEFDEDAIIDQKSEPVKRRRVHKPKKDMDPDPKRKGNLTKFTTKTSDTKNADINVGSGINQVGIVKDSDSIQAPPQEGPQVIGELIPAEMSVPEAAKSTVSVTLSLNSGDKSVNIGTMPIPTFESEGMIQDNCVEGVKSPAMEMKNDIASSHIDVSYRVVDSVHLILEDDLHDSPKGSKESVTSPTISLNAGSSEPSLSADAPICYDHTDFKTCLETKEADNTVQQSVHLVHLVGAVKDASVQQNLDPVERLGTPETHFPIECHPNDVNFLGTSNERSEKNNENISSKEEDDFKLSEGSITFTNLESDVEHHHLADADETLKPELLDLTDVDKGHVEHHEGTIDKDGCLDDELLVSDQVNKSLDEDPYNPEFPSAVIMDNEGSFQEKDVLSNENNTEINALTFNSASTRREITSHAVEISNPDEEGVASPVMEMMIGIASSHFDESSMSGIKNWQNDHVDSSNELLDRLEDVKLALDGEAYRLAEENIDVTNEEVATELYSQPDQPGDHNETHNNELLEGSTVSISAGVASPVMEMMTGIAPCHFDESAISGIKNSQNDHVDSSNELLSRVEDVNLAVEGETYGFAEENIDVMNEEVPTELYSQSWDSGDHNESHIKKLLEPSTVSVSADQPETSFLVTIDTASNVKVKEPLSYENNIECYPASTRKHEITSQVFEISNTDEDRNKMQLLFATPIKICDNSKVDETFGSKRISKNTSCLEGSSVIVDSPHNSQRKVDEERGKDYEDPKTQSLVVSIINKEKTATGSSVGNEEKLLASQTKTNASFNGNTIPGSSIRKLENFPYLEGIGTMDQHMVTPIKYDKRSEIFGELINNISIDKTCQKLEGIGSLSEESIRSLGKQNLEQETNHDHELGGKDFHEVTNSLGLLEANRFYLLSDEAALDLFESDTPKDKFPESNNHAFMEPMSPEISKGVYSCHLSNALLEPGEVTVRRVLEEETGDDQEPEEKCFNEESSSRGLLEGNRFYLLSEEAAFDFSELKTPKDNKKESLLGAFVEPMCPEEEGILSSPLYNASLGLEEVAVKKDGANVQTCSEVERVTMEADILTSNGDSWNIVKESTEIYEDGIVSSTETISTAMCTLAEPDLFSNLEMQLLAGENDKNSIDMAEGESFNSIIPASGNAHVLKESDVMETIQEYIDSESSMSVDFDDFPVDLHVEKSSQIIGTTADSETAVDFPPNVESAVKGCEVNDVMVLEKEMGHVLTEKNNARTILIHGTPRKAFAMADKENIPPSKSLQAGDLTTLRPIKRRALQEVQLK